MENVSNKYKNFELTRVVELPEIQATMKELTHLPSGASVMHIENEDTENLFSLSFQTLPKKSDGIAHILEHTVLCGSKKFPVKDPFFAMTRRSMNTFMNAMTGSDFTCYPAASQIPKDFYNLLEVYLDAVFNPNLKELSFKQEGHRLEFSVPNDPNSPLEYKGIVFNEMKGALAVPDSRVYEAIYEAIFPDLTYGINSGGNPEVIPELTYQQFLNFHKTHYDPSRCLFFFYGNMPLEGHLDFIEEHALKGIKKLDPLPPVPKQPRFKNPKTVFTSYPFPKEQDTKGNTITSFGWLTCSISEQEELFALIVLSIILMGTDAAPLKKALLKSGRCKQASCWLDNDISEIPFVITLKGCEPEDSEPLHKLIQDTLLEIVQKGVSMKAVKNAIHQVEFSKCEITGDGAPYGLSLYMRSALLKQHGGLPEEGIQIDTLSQRLRDRLDSEPRYFESLIEKWLIKNTHAVQITMAPDQNLADQEIQKEKEKLEKIKQTLSEKEKLALVKDAQKLEAFQEEQEGADIEVLPKITLEDVPHMATDYPLSTSDCGNLKVFHHDTFTNNIVYANLVFPLPQVSEEELPLLQLFCILLPQMGCGGRGYEENLEYIQAHTGGVSASLSLNRNVEDTNQFSPYFTLHGKALSRKAHKLFPLLHEMCSSADFTNVERFKEVLDKHATNLKGSFAQSAIRYAINLAGSGLSLPSRISNAWSGLEYYQRICALAEDFEENKQLLQEKMQQFQERVLANQEAHLVLTCDALTYESLKEREFYGLEKIALKNSAPWNDEYTVKKVPSQGRVMASPVAFTGTAMEAPSYTHPDAAALNIATNLMDKFTLHPLIREKGGAYGSHATVNSSAGTAFFYAYRDPNISKTLDVFELAVNDLLKGNFTDTDLEEAKLEIFQDLDSPISPGSRGHVAYTRHRAGKSFAIRQTYRDRLRHLTKDNVIEAVRKHFKSQISSAPTVIFAGKELLERENEALKKKGKEALEIFSC